MIETIYYLTGIGAFITLMIALWHEYITTSMRNRKFKRDDEERRKKK